MLRKLVTLTFAAAFAAASTQPAPSFSRKLNKEQKLQHALNRLTFGPTDADRENIKKLGLERWIDLQLNTNKLPENPHLNARLAAYQSLTLPNSQLIENYPPPNILNNLIRTGKFNTIKDPLQKARMERLAERYQARQSGKENEMARGARETLAKLLTPSQLRTLRNGAPEDRAKLYLSLTPQNRDTLFAFLPGNARNEILYGPDASLRRDLLAANAPTQVVYHDLAESKILRAVHSTHQLEELLADFWFNHFNVHFDKGFGRVLVTSYERDAIRPHIFGRFPDMLAATAQHPAMLFYLDNFTSVDPEAAARFRRFAGPRIRNNPGVRQLSGLNENYARELLELHTLGVDGGYTQKDVVEVARCFTGWSIQDLQFNPQFRFNPAFHDNGEKVVLGHKIPAGGGIEDGKKVIEILVNHPSTARFIATKLAQRFVADAPPPALVNKVAAAFTKSRGDLRVTMRALLEAPEFWSEGAFLAKIKMPLETVASALRAANAQVDSTAALQQTLQTLGQPLYRKVEPTGYSSAAEEWTNSAALLARMNFGIDLAANKIRGVKTSLPEGAGLSYGGPEFQRR
jgi:uncharacterized protein (DUF1800 family)